MIGRAGVRCVASADKKMPRRKPSEIATTGTTNHILRASLKARLYRDIEIEGTASLHDLAEAITGAFGFDHAFGFFSRLTGRVFESPVRYEFFDDEAAGGTSRGVRRTTVARVFPRLGSKMLFLFDYGDEWRFRIEVVGRGEAAARTAYPRVGASVGEAPQQYPDPEEG
jgi:hypothetical protein